MKMLTFLASPVSAVAFLRPPLRLDVYRIGYSYPMTTAAYCIRRLRMAATGPVPGTPSLSVPPSTSKAGSPPSTVAPEPTTAPRILRVRDVREAQGIDDQLLRAPVTIRGWVRSVRDQKSCAFIDVNDGSSLTGLQVVVDAEASAFETARNLTTGCAVCATGTIVESPGKGQRFELRAHEITLVGPADGSYPLQKKGHSYEFLRSIAHLRPRTNAIGAVARVRSTLAIATHNFFNDRGFLYVNSPIITASDCEGAGQMFRVTTAIPPNGDISKIPSLQGNVTADASQHDPQENQIQPLEHEAKDSGPPTQPGVVDFAKDFFGCPAFLTVSGQLSAETYACALSNVYTFGPTFRAENSNTTRHLAEFWMIEPEMAFATLEDNMDSAEDYVKTVVSVVLDRCAPDIEFFDRFVERGLLDKLRKTVEAPFARISYTDAISLLSDANKPNKKGVRRFEYPVDWGCDLQTEHERYLAEEHFKKPVFVYNYPSSIKAFYMRCNDEDEGRTVQAVDLLVPGIGELIGGSAREERLDVLLQKIHACGLNEDDYKWYLDLRRYGSVPHAGYGLGFERLILFVTGMENIREVIPYPRYPGSAQF